MSTLPVRYPSTLPPSLPEDAPAADHAEWCENFERLCRRRAALCRDYFNMPAAAKWTKAAEMARFAATCWREREP